MREVTTDASDVDSDSTLSESSEEDDEDTEEPEIGRSRRRRNDNGHIMSSGEERQSNSVETKTNKHSGSDLYGEVMDATLPPLAGSIFRNESRRRATEGLEKDQGARTMISPILSTLVLVYLALITARVPVLWADLIA